MNERPDDAGRDGERPNEEHKLGDVENLHHEVFRGALNSTLEGVFEGGLKPGLQARLHAANVPVISACQVARTRHVLGMLTAIVTLSCNDDSLGSLRRFVADAEMFGVPDTLELLDGGHARVAGDQSAIGDAVVTLGDVKRYVAACEHLMDDEVLLFGADVALDLPVELVSPIECGNHRSPLPTNVVVTVHPECQTC